MAQTLRGATLKVTVRVRLPGPNGKRIEILSDPVMTNTARQRLANALDSAFVATLPVGDYVFERSLRNGLRMLHVPRDGNDAGVRMLGDLLVPTNELLSSLVQTIRDVLTRDAAARILAEAYRFICERIVATGDVARIRPNFVEWHFRVKSGVEQAIDQAMQKQESHDHATLRDAKRDLVVVDRDGKVHAYLEVTRDACPFLIMHLTESSQVLERLVPDAERRAVIKLFRRLTEEARQRWDASERIRVAYRFEAQPAPPQALADGPIMAGGEPGEA
ncbi:hypothetical protein EBS80_01710 [bacterium]|nr:hypothetical protein [bacterium]